MGHLLALTGDVDTRTINKLKHDAERIGKGSFAYAWVMDAHEEERERGVTMDVAIQSFETLNRHVTILDSPGHEDFIEKMISGAAQADAGLLLIDSVPGAFEAGFSGGGQTREHGTLAKALGITSLIVVVNKLDYFYPTESEQEKEQRNQYSLRKDIKQEQLQTLDSQQQQLQQQQQSQPFQVNTYESGFQASFDRFIEIHRILSPFLQSVGCRPNSVRFVPVNTLPVPPSKFTQQQLSSSSSSSSSPIQQQQILPLRIAITDSFQRPYIPGLSVIGRIECGSGDIVEMLIQSLDGKELVINPGDVLTSNSSSSSQSSSSSSQQQYQSSSTFTSPIHITRKFRAQIVALVAQPPVLKGTQCALYFQAKGVEAVVNKLICLIDKRTGEEGKKKPRVIPQGTTALVEIQTTEPICIEAALIPNAKDKDKQFESTSSRQEGRIVLRKEGRTIAAGLVTEILSEKEKKKKNKDQIKDKKKKKL
ncbi:MAG: putative Elongation factor 1-alpha [Streblomastix strix]|uniref:Putative Elongation factor 1-alpha n=1 Tax=Streblomastix strix TaxID=222440 RepID=A0A5J4WE07_9EUKA|nr:MAG: putative Elongation factor 1-alpha [Streblomastix strix]